MREGFWVGSAFLLHPVNLTADLREADLSVAKKQFKTMALFISEMNFQQLIIPKAEIHCWAHVPSSSALFQRPGCLPVPWHHSGNYSDPEIFKCCFRSHLPHSVPYYYRLAVRAGMVAEELWIPGQALSGSWLCKWLCKAGGGRVSGPLFFLINLYRKKYPRDENDCYSDQ